MESLLSPGHLTGHAGARSYCKQSHLLCRLERVETSARRVPFTQLPAGKGAQSLAGDAKQSSGPFHFKCFAVKLFLVVMAPAMLL